MNEKNAGRLFKAYINIITSLALQVVTFICGLIVPRAILSYFGSDINGTISTITQFLAYITLLEAGSGGVIKAALYKPITDNNNSQISTIINSARKFFKRIAYVYLLFMIVLAFVSPFIINTQLKYEMVLSLVFILGFSSFIQYYFGITEQIYLQAENKTYIVSLSQIIAISLNAISTVLLIRLGLGILIVKFVTSLILALRPIILRIYVRKHYHLNTKTAVDMSSIKQRWDGFAQQIAFFIHSNTDVIILSICLSTTIASVYTIYLMIVSGIQKIVNSVVSGFNAVLGSLYAENNKELLNQLFKSLETCSLFICFLMFSVTYVEIIPFVILFTDGVNDINYIRPIFALILILSELIYCIRLPYQCMILEAGHYKQTRRGAYVEASINIFLSLILVQKYQLCGIAFATMIAMSFRTIDYILYLSKNIIIHNPLLVLKKVSLDSILSIIGIVLSKYLTKSIIISSYSVWLLHAVIVTSIIAIVLLMGNAVFFGNDLKRIINRRE